ncbi:MAG: hypothetical protein QF903_02875 [Planctomycetota bacterium]|jgi:anti-sigma factor RsiW|nr:hypothetical protein [Planctomycetota bacterium]MDP6762879.1 hypothetical protein [Planctomycetota bacterium]MDP6988404.1 hypothetical protein [Planctomycetota bacterium]
MERPPTCSEVRGDLPLFVGADLEVSALEALANHLEACGDCRAELARLDDARRTLRSVKDAPAPAFDPWPALRSELADKGRLAAAPPAFSARRRSAVAAAALVIALGGLWAGERLGAPAAHGPNEGGGLAGGATPAATVAAPAPGAPSAAEGSSASVALRPVEPGARLADHAASFAESLGDSLRGGAGANADPIALTPGGASTAGSPGRLVLPPQIR